MESQYLGEPPAQLSTIAHHVDEALLQQKLGTLEAGGQLLAYGLLNDPGSGKATQRIGLSDNDVAFHGEARHNAACGGITEHRDEQPTRIRVTFDSTRGLGHLHQRQCTFLHACATGEAKAHHRKVFLEGMFEQPGNLLSHYRAHRTHHETGIHSEDTGLITAYSALTCNDALAFAGLIAQLGKLFGVIWEAKWITALQIGPEFPKAAGIRKKGDAGARRDAHVVIAHWTYPAATV